MYYFVARVYLEQDRLIWTVGDRFLDKLPGNDVRLFLLRYFEYSELFLGWAIISEVMKVSAGTVKSCTNILNNGNMLAISPGGVYEAQFGNNYYELLWQGRMGFAKVAIESKAVNN